MTDQQIAVVAAIVGALILWYSMNPPKKEKCCMI